MEKKIEQPVERTSEMIERAERAAAALKEANEESKLILERAEKLRAQEILGGTTDAGQVPAEKVETPKEYADKVLRGEVKAK